jgi:soluble lytic murein transglycosylase-like protein
MRILKLSLKRFCPLFVLAMIDLSALTALHAAPPAVPAAPRLTQSVVTVDPRTGQLRRRSIVVSPAQKPAAAPKTKAPNPKIADLIRDSASRNAVDPALVQSVMHQESAYNPVAVSRAGALGLMQLMPATARRFGVANPFDPQQNIEGGVRYLKHLQTLFGGNLELTLAAYNAGENAVARHGNRIPPYRETLQYVAKVARSYRAKPQPAPAAAPVRAAEPVPPEIAPSPTPEPQYRPIEVFADEHGRIFLRTKPL